MQLELTDTEREELARLVAGALSDLSSEIADTDNPEFRRLLRERRSNLATILAQLVSLE